jgi:amino acid permease
MTLSLGSRGDSRIYLVVTFISLTFLFLNKTILIRYSKILIASVLSILLIVLVFLNRFWITIFDIWYFINAKQESDQPNAFVTLMLDFPAFFFSLTGGQSPSFDQNRGALFDN